MRFVVTVLPDAAAGAVGSDCPIAADISRRTYSLAERLGKVGATRYKGHLRGTMLTARPQGRYSGSSSMRIYFRRVDG